MRCKFAEGRLELIGSHLVGRHVDEVAGKENAGKLALDIGGVGVARDHEPRRGRLLRLVAFKAIAAEAETERKAIRRQRRGFDVPIAGGQRTREPAR